MISQKIKEQEKKQAIQDEIDKQVEEEKKLQEEGKLDDPKCSNVNTKGKRCGISVTNAGDKCTIHESVPQRVDGKPVQCKGKNSDGDRCGIQTKNKSGLCYYHD